MWFHTLSYAIEFHRTFFNRDSFTGIKCLVRQFNFILVFSPFIHIPSTGILAFSLIFLSLSSSFPSLLLFQHVTSNSIESITFHGNQMPCPPIQFHPRLFPFHSYPFHGNFSIFPHLSFSLVFFPFSSLFFEHVTSNSIESITFHGNLFVHSFNQSSPSSSSFFSF